MYENIDITYLHMYENIDASLVDNTITSTQYSYLNLINMLTNMCFLKAMFWHKINYRHTVIKQYYPNEPSRELFKGALIQLI